MDKTALEDLFAPIGRIILRRMFGGAVLYLHDLCIALVYDGTLWLKIDDATRASFEKAGSRAFTYQKKAGEVSVMSFWLIPDICYEDEDELRRFVALAEQAARRAAINTGVKKAKNTNSASAKPKNKP